MSNTAPWARDRIRVHRAPYVFHWDGGAWIYAEQVTATRSLSIRIAAPATRTVASMLAVVDAWQYDLDTP